MNPEKKTICLINSCELPVPAVYGGAIETLINILIDQNEIEQKVNFIVVTVYKEEAAALSKKYRHTKFIFLERNEDVDRKITRVIKFFRNGFRKYTKGIIRIPEGWQWFEMVRNYKLRNVQADYYVAEGGTYYSFEYFQKKYGRDRVWLHVHHEIFADKLFDKIFGHVIAVSRFALNQYMKDSDLPAVCGKVVYNCVDEELSRERISEQEKHELRAKLGISDEEYVIIYSGRIVPEKGIQELIDAVKSLKMDHIRLLIAGGIRSALGGVSDYYTQIMKEVDESDGKILYLGYIDNKEMYRYYQMADVQVVPSVWEEVAGLVTIEAMLCGLPLIVTNSGGMVEYVEDDSVIKVERGDALSENIANAIAYLYDHPEEAKQRGLREQEYAKRFSKNRYYDEFLKAFDII